MDSSPVLRQQSQNKIRNDFLRMKNEHNKKHPDPKASKLVSAPHLSCKDSENKDPGGTEHGWKAPVRPGVSRLPVLAKSIHLQTPSDFSQSHCRWEEKPLAGKSKKKKPCTRPVPFNLSQPKSTRMATKDQQPMSVQQSRTGPHATQPENSLRSAKTTKHPAVLNSNGDSTKGMGRSHGKMTENTSHLPAQSGPSGTFKTSTALSNPLSSIANNTMHQTSTTSSVPPAVGASGAEACLDTMNQLSLKDTSQTAQLSTQGSSSKALTDKGENFQTDHLALLSILQNKGVTAVASTTPQSKPYNYLPQRVPVTKTRPKAAPSTASAKSVEFSPDPAALQSILQNEGVKPGRVTGATPRNSVCPPGRGTSVYRAQRVPIRKNRAESTGGPVAVALKEIKWTPQRVPNTRHQPMSAMKWHMSTKQYTTPGRRGCKSNVQLQQEEVVQRLFDDQEDEKSTNVTDRDSEVQADQLPVETSAAMSHCEEKVEMSETSEEEEEEEEEEEKKFVGGQMFLQAPHRESVIFFSTGKKLIRAPRVEKPEGLALQHRHGPVSSEQRQFVPVQDDVSAESEPSCQINPSVQRLHRDLIVQKTSSLSPAVALLRKRLPPLEELRMDEEVATYTSLSGPAPPRFLPPPPRCGNPLASILYFEESTRFVPIAFDVSSDSSSPLSSPLQER